MKYNVYLKWEKPKKTWEKPKKTKKKTFQINFGLELKVVFFGFPWVFFGFGMQKTKKLEFVWFFDDKSAKKTKKLKEHQFFTTTWWN